MTSEPTILPAAKRLAEENNVDWRRLKGTGPGDAIVETDVITYLARVMAGDEDVNPTAEPVPAGMEAWPEADVRAFEAERRGQAPKAAPRQDPPRPAAPPQAAPSPASAAKPAAPNPAAGGAAKYQAALSEIKRLQAEVQALKEQQAKALAPLQALKSESATLRKDLERAQAANTAQSALKAERDHLSAKLSEAQIEAARYRKVAEALEQERDALNSKLEQASQKRPWWKLFG